MDNLTVANRAIGIDIGSHSVKVASVHQRLGAVSIEKTVEARIRREEDGSVSPDSIAEALADAMTGLRVRKDVVVVGTPTQAAAVRSLQIPFSDTGKARAVIKFQAEPHLPFPIEEVVVDFFDTKTGTENRIDVLLTAMKKEVLRERLDLMRGIGIDPEVLEVDFMAVYNTVKKAGGISEGSVLLMDIGSSKTIVAYVKEGMPLALRSFPVGGDTITGAIARDLGVSFEEAEETKTTKATAQGDADDPENGSINRAVKSVLDRFSGEVSRTLRFFASQFTDSGEYRTVLTGGGAMLCGMADYMSEILGHETMVLESLDNIRDNTGSEFATARFATAIGLGLRGIGETEFLQNFRQEELAYSQTYRRMRKSIYTSVALLAAIILTYIAGIVVKAHVLNARSEDLTRKVKFQVTTTVDNVPNTRDAGKLVETLKAAVMNKRKELSDLRGTQLLSVLNILKELSTLTRAEMEIELTKFNINDTDAGAVLVMEGSAKTNDDVMEIERMLKESNAFTSVKSDPTKVLPRGNESRYRFGFKALF